MTEKSSSLKILNYGAGAVGLGLDSFLLKARENVIILGRPRTVQALQVKGLKRTGLFGAWDTPSRLLRPVCGLSDIPSQKFDYILVATKSFDSEFAAKDIKRHQRLWDASTKIILCQNGWGNAEIFAKFFSEKQIFNARIITGFERASAHEVRVTVHADAVHLGSIFGSPVAPLEPLAQALSAGGLPTRVVKNIAKDLWAKMLYNCALNPLGAIFDVTYGDLGNNEFSRRLMHDIMKESFAVMTRAGYKTHWPTLAQYEKAFYGRLLPPTASHRSSTLQDLNNGRRTEIDALNGTIVHLGTRWRIPVMTNKTVYQMVKFLEAKKMSSKNR